ncbi:MAG: DUF3604 domain-containing protein, partial [Myxococcota bacterium]|nr:DUF3604 domain-containing protein [Myxococcota bacterium]
MKLRVTITVCCLAAACGGGTPSPSPGDAGESDTTVTVDASASDDAETTPAGLVYTEEREPCADRDPLRRALFGDLHVHTELSFDAWTNDVRTTMDQAYAFATGEPVLLPPLDAAGEPTR